MSMDDVRVDQWRAEQFDRMGFSPEAVALLLDWAISPAEVRPWIEAGCPRETALRIVRPLEIATPIPLVAQAEQYSVKV